ncbi:MAG: hypothetical protein PHY44_00480 [Lachnospiraceae bacterium]|nr:hypothetical protein [Lachnospiraceae bacterium]
MPLHWSALCDPKLSYRQMVCLCHCIGQHFATQSCPTDRWHVFAIA